ncbi:MAG TPA: aquaporin [Candidatus Saccharimonadales bacterium]|nr:aquaporin [Candidatus Saccharimonadales bacterium]
MFSRKKIAMLVAEFVGTGILTAVVLAVSKSNIGIPYFVSIAVGLTLAALCVMLATVSGAHLNPAITLGLWSARRIKTLPAVTYIAAQLAGGICAYLLYTYFVNTHWANSGKFESRVLVAEATGAFVFAMGWAATVYQKLEAGKAAFAIGASLTVGMMVASIGSGGMLNPAVALGTRSWVWGTYVLGPILGAIIGFNLYALLFAPADALMDSPATKPKAKK